MSIHGHRGNVLVVDDEAIIRFATGQWLTDQGYTVLEASGADEALALLRERPTIELLFTDVHMAGSMDGVALAATAVRLSPDLQAVITSGQWTPDGSTLPDRSVFVPKPYRMAELDRLFIGLLSARSCGGQNSRGRADMAD